MFTCEYMLIDLGLQRCASAQVEGSMWQPAGKSQPGPGEATPAQGAPIRELLTSG